MFGLPSEITSKVEKQGPKFYNILKNSLKPKNEEILIVSDYGSPGKSIGSMLAYGYYHAAKRKGIKVSLLFQEVKKGFMHADEHIVDAMKCLDNGSIVILSLSNKLGRFGGQKSFRNFCKAKEHRFISATGLGDMNSSYFDLFMETMNVNYSRLSKKGMKIKKIWDKAEEIQVKTVAGTDITFNVSGMESIANIGKYHEKGSGGNMPAGEVYIPPYGYEGVKGKVVIDGSMKTEDGTTLVDSPVTLTIESGRIVNMEGKYVPLLERTFQRFEDRARYPYRVRHIGELGIGINPGAVLIGSMVMDEKVLGTGHIAVGSNYWFGGDIRTILHADQVFKNPTFYVDGKKMDI